jgi:hypothetical protein
MQNEITVAELKAENSDPGAFKSALLILNQFPPENQKVPERKPLPQSGNNTMATTKKWKGWFMAKV